MSESLKKMMQQKEAEFEASKEARAKDRELEDAKDVTWDPDEGVKWEPPMYFKSPQQLLHIFAALEERNLFLIQNSQETEEQLEELKQKLESTKAKMNAETETLNSQIKSLKDAIATEEAKATALTERANPLHKGAGGGHGTEADTEVLLAALHKRVAEVYERCGIGDDATSGTLMMLANIEQKLEENLAAIERMPTEEVERAEKEREKERRLRVRTEKMAAQKKAQEDRINKSIERSKAPVQKKTGKPIMFRAPPLETRKRVTDIKEERNEDEEDLREFLTE
jgi:hypothetical protein